MNTGTLKTLEFERIVEAVMALAVTPTGRERLAGLTPLIDAARVTAAQKATTEGVRFLVRSRLFTDEEYLALARAGRV